jgi:hypothetical protein
VPGEAANDDEARIEPPARKGPTYGTAVCRPACTVGVAGENGRPFPYADSKYGADILVRKAAQRLSVVRPNSRSSELKQIIVHISEVQTSPASLPSNLRFNLHSAFAQPPTPSGERIRRNSKREMSRPASLMRRNHAPGNNHRFLGSVVREEQQDIRTNPQSTEAIVTDHGLKAE